MDERLVSAARVLPDYLGQHVLLSASALALGVVLNLPLAVAAVGRPRLRWPVLAIASAIQTIPGLALLALFYPLLLALSARRALDPLIGAITTERMREANLMVDRDQDRALPGQAARFLAKVSRLAPP